jgi:hypothetical protein
MSHPSLSQADLEVDLETQEGWHGITKGDLRFNCCYSTLALTTDDVAENGGPLGSLIASISAPSRSSTSTRRSPKHMRTDTLEGCFGEFFKAALRNMMVRFRIVGRFFGRLLDSFAMCRAVGETQFQKRFKGAKVVELLKRTAQKIRVSRSIQVAF